VGLQGEFTMIAFARLPILSLIESIVGTKSFSGAV